MHTNFHRAREVECLHLRPDPFASASKRNSAIVARACHSGRHCGVSSEVRRFRFNPRAKLTRATRTTRARRMQTFGDKISRHLLNWRPTDQTARRKPSQVGAIRNFIAPTHELCICPAERLKPASPLELGRGEAIQWLIQCPGRVN